MKDMKVCILDYGSGNVGSVYNIVSLITPNVVISNDDVDVVNSSHLILPGVGAFNTSMQKINKHLPVKIINQEVIIKKKPFLGICVGLQVLATRGFEFGEHPGLNWIPGEVNKLDSNKLPLPHIGWNDIHIVRNSPIVKRFNYNPDFYFVHSFVFKPKFDKHIISKTNYGQDFCSIIQKDNIFGVQFHPEKSQKAGKILLENFLEL